MKKRLNILIFFLSLFFPLFLLGNLKLSVNGEEKELKDYFQKEEKIYLSSRELFSLLDAEVVFSSDQNWLFIKGKGKLCTIDLARSQGAIGNEQIKFASALKKDGVWYLSEDFLTEVYAKLTSSKIELIKPEQKTPSSPEKLNLPRNFKKDPVDVVVIDPGHGGSNLGATTPEGWREKDLTLTLAKMLKKKLLRVSGLKVYLTREQDQDLALEERSKFANQVKGDLFISIHANAYNSIRVSGVESYFLSLEATDEESRKLAFWENLGAEGELNSQPLFENDELGIILGDMLQSEHIAESEILAKIIQKNLTRALKSKNRGVRQAPFRVLMGVNMPAVLVEVGFLTNPDDLLNIINPANQEKIVDALYQSILEFQEMKSRKLGMEEGNAPEKKK